MARVKHMIEICARTDANVLLCGETGVGKDLIAGIIHRLSHRRGFPYVKVGCTLFPANLIESELYGHEKGSFTGAEQRRKGRFDVAEGGTLYLDDVDDIPLEQQSKLLRAIEEKVFERVGGTPPIKANVRFVASTKRNLLEKIAAGTFREDLYYRLDVLRMWSRRCASAWRMCPCWPTTCCAQISGGTEYRWTQGDGSLQRHSWPGNVRELAHTLERVYLIGGGRDYRRAAGRRDDGSAPRPTSGQDPPAGDFQATVEQTERELLSRALQAADGNKTAAAAALAMKPSTFRDKLAKYGLG